MPAILWLEDVTPDDRALVGGKAFNLAQVKRAGLLVPDGFCVTVSVYQDFIAANDLEPAIRSLLRTPAEDILQAVARLQDAIRAGQIGPEAWHAILSAYDRLAAGRKPLAVSVRSSALTEDLPTASFAGQQATLLNVRDQARLLTAIVECWASLWSSQAVLYRAHQGVGEEPAMAILVQRMVPAESAGVAFSCDPVSGEERVLIEAAWGLGEAVVSGAGEVDRYAVSRETGQEVEPPVVAHKQQMRVMADCGGLQTVEVPAHARDMRVLTPEQLQEIQAAVLALEDHFGCPQDMEWAFADGQLYILQSRPITRAADDFFTTSLPDGDEVWTAGFLNERFPLPVSPLGWTVINESLERLAFRDPLRYLGLRNVDRVRLTRLYRGHPYVNLFVFQTLYKVFPDSLLPEDAYRYFPSGKTDMRRMVGYPRSLFDPRFLGSMAWHFLQQPAVWSPWHNYRVWAAFTAQHDACSQRLEAEYEALCTAGGTVQQVWAVIQEAQEVNHRLLSLHRWSLTCADLAYSLLRRLTRAWVKREDAMELCSQLVTALPNRSLDMNRALQDLARHEANSSAFADALAGFLKEYGHRSFYLDVYHPTFADEPAQVLDLLQRLGPPYESRWDERAAMRQQAQRALHQALGRGLRGWLKRRVFDHVMYLAQRYLPLREDQRFYWQKTLAQMRRLFLLLGEQMAKAGILVEASHVFFLTKAELEAYVRESGPVGELRPSAKPRHYAQLAISRQRQFVRLCQDAQIAPERAYPPFLRGNRPWMVEGAEHAARLQGHGISPGLAQGRVVTARSPAEFGKIQRGDVLLAPGVDPGWTPVFGLLSALILEHGGQLSHAAVMAREYGLPAVAGIPGILTALRDGDVVLVDGLEGWVSKVAPPRTT